jgi:LacI family transcriptional regulator
MVQATIRDVALRAEVSVASVSRALNNNGGVHPDTRERVIAAAAELGYVPHAGARSLSLAHANALGVVLPDLHGEFFSELVRGIDREASLHGFLLLLSNMHEVNGQPAAGLRAMRGRVDGLLVMAPHIRPEELARALPAGMPAVLVNAPDAVDGYPGLRVDNHAGAEAIVRHLLQCGRRRIVHIRGPLTNLDAREREEGFRQAMATLAPDLPASVIAGDFEESSGEAAAAAVRAGGYDAVFAANDMMAIGCLHALRTAGIDVPGEIAVAGFDDVPLARYLALTTMRVHIADMGGLAIRRLVHIVGGGTDYGIERMAPELVVRGTTIGAPA